MCSYLYLLCANRENFEYRFKAESIPNGIIWFLHSVFHLFHSMALFTSCPSPGCPSRYFSFSYKWSSSSKWFMIDPFHNTPHSSPPLPLASLSLPLSFAIDTWLEGIENLTSKHLFLLFFIRIASEPRSVVFCNKAPNWCAVYRKMLALENADEILEMLDRFTKQKPTEIPPELNEYIRYVAKTGDTVYHWPSIQYLFREKLLSVIKDFHDTTSNVEGNPRILCLTDNGRRRFIYHGNGNFTSSFLCCECRAATMSECWPIQLRSYEDIAIHSLRSLPSCSVYHSTLEWATGASEETLYATRQIYASFGKKYLGYVQETPM